MNLILHWAWRPDRTAIVWNLADHKPVSHVERSRGGGPRVAFSPDGTTIATASEDATVKLWKTADWTERASMTGTEGVMFWCLAFSPAGRTLAAGAFDGTVKLYDPSDGKERKTLRGPTEAITAVAFAPGALEIIAGSVDKSLRRWKAETGSAAIAQARKGDNDKAPELKPAEAATALNAVLLDTRQPVLSLVYSKDGHRLAVGAGLYRTAGSLQLWDLTKREKLWQGEEFKYGLPAVAFSDDEKRIAFGNFTDNFLRLFDATNGKQLKEIRGHRNRVIERESPFSPNGKFFATCFAGSRRPSYGTLRPTKRLKSFSGHTDFVYSIAFSPDGKRLLSGSSDRTARLWDIESGKEVAQLKGHQGVVQQAVYCHDGSLIATASSRPDQVRIYDSGG